MHERNAERAPRTTALLTRFPQVTTMVKGNAKFALMAPGSHLQAHCGPTNARLRLHLGLVCPPTSTIRVHNETRFGC
jgi:aspartate beta-hydroxylase